MKVAIICNDARHVRTMLGLNPSNPDLVIVTPENTKKMYGLKDIYYYEMRPMYAREKSYAEQHGWSGINRRELMECME